MTDQNDFIIQPFGIDIYGDVFSFEWAAKPFIDRLRADAVRTKHTALQEALAALEPSLLEFVAQPETSKLNALAALCSEASAQWALATGEPFHVALAAEYYVDLYLKTAAATQYRKSNLSSTI